MKARFYLLISLFTALFTLLGWNLYGLQIEKGALYTAKVDAQTAYREFKAMRRGEIYITDKNNANIQVAYARDFMRIFAVPKDITDDAAAALMLAPLVGKDEQKLARAFANKESEFYPLMEKADDATVHAIQSLSLGKGVVFERRPYRFYPSERLAAQTVGYAGMSDESIEPIGRYGIEKRDEVTLAEGNDVHLTLDRTLQEKAEQMLAELIRDHKASGGSILIQEPKTGKMLAIANAPDFDPNRYGEFNIASFVNAAVQGMYEPGSVFKPITMAAGIDSGALTPETTYTDTGSVTLNGKTITNWDQRAHGLITMTNVIEDSVNTGTVFAERKIGHEIFLSYVKRFGFGELTGVDLPDEIRGTLRSLESKNARAIDFATASYGQGPAVTPIQLISAFSSIANGGLLMKPFVHADESPHIVRRVMAEETAGKVTRMMESAVRKANVAAIPNYRVAGKTGTAFVARNGRYSDDLIHSYVGFAPASEPRFTILIKLDLPDKPLAGITVVPKFKQLAQSILTYYEIAPDALITSKP